MNIDLVALPKTNYIFDYWELNNHVVTPDEFTPEVILQLTQSDIVVAHFKLFATDVSIEEVIITEDMCEQGTGTVTINATDGTPPYQYSINGIDFF